MELSEANISAPLDWSFSQEDDDQYIRNMTVNNGPYHMQYDKGTSSLPIDDAIFLVDPQMGGTIPLHYDIDDAVRSFNGVQQAPPSFNYGDRTISIPLRTRRDFAKPDDWERARPVITELYQEMSLDQVMKEMRKRSFFASKKMFKARITNWGIEKKLKAAEVLDMIRIRNERLASGKDTEFFLRGKSVAWSRVENYLRRNKKTIAQLQARKERRSAAPSIDHRTPSPPPAPVASQTSITTISLPAYLHLYDMLPKLFADYVTGAMESKSWIINKKTGTIQGRAGYKNRLHLDRWFEGMLEAFKLIQSGRIQLGFALLHATLDRTKNVLQGQEPDLLLKLLLSIIALGRSVVDERLGTEVTAFIQRLTALVLPQRHPIQLFWQHWSELQTLSVYELFRRMFRPFIDRVMKSANLMASMPNILVDNYFELQSSLTNPPWSEIEQELRALVERLEICHSHGRALSARLNLSLAEVLLRQNIESLEGTAILQRMGDWLFEPGVDRLVPAIEQFQCTWYLLQQWIHSSKHEWERGYICCRQWLPHFNKSQGPASPMALEIHSDLVFFGSKIQSTDLRSLDIEWNKVATSYVSRFCLEDDGDGNNKRTGAQHSEQSVG